MKIKGTTVRVSIVQVGLVIALTLILLAYVILSGDYRSLLWAVPVLIMLLVIPTALNYMSQSQYDDLIPYYEAEAVPTRMAAIRPNDIGKIVRVEGVVERVLFKSLNRPQYHIADKSGVMSVKMFTTPKEDVNKDDVVEVLGQVIKRYVVVGEPVINAVVIRRINTKKT
ncbi:nucleotide-binding protein [Methanogenium organophilum]|uniref:Nucleotide-binding protein n=1 Tax=Methanogenium organophilum TaxID=2199 RepID=A0A9X9S517_METOG|nr:nucleotide-binding protein [Methanogenium organophilum]WAI01588.1 nucleotide-binding protein [Methanogenium organophilum]